MIDHRGTRLYWRPHPPPKDRALINTIRPDQDVPVPDLAGAGAPCTRPDANPEDWFPVGGTSDPRARAAMAAYARDLCAPCPVRDACREWAVAIGVTDGIWGGIRFDGLNGRDRRDLRRRTA